MVNFGRGDVLATGGAQAGTGAISTTTAAAAAAKLYLNWQLSEPVQASAFDGWSVRTDVAPAGGLKPIWEYPNANLDGFP